MYRRLLVTLLALLAFALSGSTGSAASPPRMRPYSGTGLVVFSSVDNAQAEGLQLPLYKEPGLARVGMLKSSRLSGNEWIFGLQVGDPPLIVSARKGNWLRVFYDDAGREAWIDPQNKGHYQSWEQFLKVQPAHLLSGLQPHYYQLLEQPGGKIAGTLTPKQSFNVLKIEDGWGMVLVDQVRIGWLRWCDDDGRLLVGFEP